MIEGDKIKSTWFTGAVRGELIINKTNWSKLQEKYEDLIAPRNFAAGIINRKDIDEDIKYIDLVVYKVTGQEDSNTFANRQQILDFLAENFKHYIPRFYYPCLDRDCWQSQHTSTFKQFKQMGYELDGLVLTQDNVVYAGDTTKGYLYDEVAFKFQAETAQTVIKEIEWTLSRTQRLVPVAIVEPVELSGAIIQRATCNNAQMVRDLGLGKGAVIEIQRANEVIPYIVQTLEESTETLPTECPICHSKLEWNGVDLKCVNPDCQNVKSSDLQQWCECIGETDGLQWTLMKQYLDNYGVTSLDTLYNEKVKQTILTDLSSRQLSITEQKIYTFFKKLYIDKIDIDKILLGLNIPRLGKKTVQILGKEEQLIKDLLVLCLYYNTYKDNYLEPYQKCLSLVKEATTESIFNNLKKFANIRYMFGRFIDNTERINFIKDESNNLDTKYIAVTGSLVTMKRKDFEDYIRKYGYELSGNLKKCKYLVTNTPDSGSNKNKQAQEYNIPIITEQEFLAKLG